MTNVDCLKMMAFNDLVDNVVYEYGIDHDGVVMEIQEALGELDLNPIIERDGVEAIKRVYYSTDTLAKVVGYLHSCE